MILISEDNNPSRQKIQTTGAINLSDSARPG
jgi:hypothetical protein